MFNGEERLHIKYNCSKYEKNDLELEMKYIYKTERVGKNNYKYKLRVVQASQKCLKASQK